MQERVIQQMIGSFIFVLHSHVPYVRKSGKWPHGEEMLYEIIAETYLPLLNTLDSLHKEKINTRLTLGLTPVLLEQLADKYMQAEFVKYIKARIKATKKDRILLKKTNPLALDVNEFYINWYEKTLEDYEKKYNRDLISAFKYFQDNAGVDILTSAATHGYLPLLSKDSAIWGQLKTGIKQYTKYFNRSPTGIWLPECAYRPITSEGRKGIEHFLDELNIKYFFTDSHVIEAANGNISYEEVVSMSLGSETFFNGKHTLQSSGKKKKHHSPDTQVFPTTFNPYFVDTSDVLAFGRDNITGMQVWSAQWGYPGDFDYREFHKKAPSSGNQYWKITDRKQGMKFKELYIPQNAQIKAEVQAEHFVNLVADHLLSYNSRTGKTGVVVSSYDTELFGHWWFEGVHWLECALRAFAHQNTVELTSAREYTTQQNMTTGIELPESSWGNSGNHSTWLNEDTQTMWNQIHETEKSFELLVKNNKKAVGVKKKFLNQCARELLLLQSSDWPFLVTTVQAKDFAYEKFDLHYNRYKDLYRAISSNDFTITKIIEDSFLCDNAFKDIDYRDFA